MLKAHSHHHKDDKMGSQVSYHSAIGKKDEDEKREDERN